MDVYSSNETLQKELNRLAWASAAGNLTLGALSLATGALTLQVASNVRMLEQARNLVESTPPSELSKCNRDLLRRMQVPDVTANGFLQNRVLSPRHQTIIIASMMALSDIPGLMFQQMAELITGYNALVAPVHHIAMVLNLPVVITVKNSAMLLPIDRLLWTERSAGVAQNLAGLKPSGPEIWMTGDASPRAEAGLKDLGLALTQRCGKQLPLLD